MGKRIASSLVNDSKSKRIKHSEQSNDDSPQSFASFQSSFQHKFSSNSLFLNTLIASKATHLLARAAVQPSFDVSSSINALIALNTPTSLHSLVRIIRCKSPSDEEKSRIKHFILKCFRHSFFEYRSAACMALGSIGKFSDQIKLCFAAADSHDSVRVSVINALMTMSNRGIKLGLQVYNVVKSLCNDTDWNVRYCSCFLLPEFVRLYPNHLVDVTPHTFTLVDQTFILLMKLGTDSEVSVRIAACRTLGQICASVSLHIQLQTLSKVHLGDSLLSNNDKDDDDGVMVTVARKKDGGVDGGAGQSSNTRLQLDMCELDEITVNEDKDIIRVSADRVPHHAAGVFVHGLEDEFSAVRLATIDSIIPMAINNTLFALKSIDFLIDMFNDDVDEVRTRAILGVSCLCKRWTSQLTINSIQLQTILSLLIDPHLSTRHRLHRLLAEIVFVDDKAFYSAINALLQSLTRFAFKDIDSVTKSMYSLGFKHPTLVAFILDKLILKNFSDLSSPIHQTLLILLHAASANNPHIVSRLTSHQQHQITLCASKLSNVSFNIKMSKLNFLLSDSMAQKYSKILLHVKHSQFSLAAKTAQSISSSFLQPHLHASCHRLCIIFTQWLFDACQILTYLHACPSRDDDDDGVCVHYNVPMYVPQRLRESSLIMLHLFSGLDVAEQFHIRHANFASKVLTWFLEHREPHSFDLKTELSALRRHFSSLQIQSSNEQFVPFPLESWSQVNENTTDLQEAFSCIIPQWIPCTNKATVFLALREAKIILPQAVSRGCAIQLHTHTPTIIHLRVRLKCIREHESEHIRLMVSIANHKAIDMGFDTQYFSRVSLTSLYLEACIELPHTILFAHTSDIQQVDIRLLWRESHTNISCPLGDHTRLYFQRVNKTK